MANLVKNIFIAGADGILGREVFKYFANLDCNVVATVFDRKVELELMTQVKPGRNKPLILACDLGDEAQVKACAQKAVAHLGRIEALINVAGGFVWSKLAEATTQQFDFLVNANTRSNWLLTKYVAPHMAANNFGRIVYISAASTLKTVDTGFGLYVGSKLFLNAIVQAAAAEHGDHHVHTNAILPTIIDTPRNRADMPDADFSVWVQPSAIVEMITRLLDTAPSCPNGTLVVT